MFTNRRSSFILSLILILSVVLFAACGGDDEAIPEADRQAAITAPNADEAVSPNLAPDPDKVVAIVNGGEITAEKVYEVASVNMAQMAAQGITFTEEQERMHRILALDLILDNQILMQEAEKRAIQVAPVTLEDQIQSLKDQQGTEDEFEQYLANAGISEADLRDEVARRLQMQNLATLLTRNVTASDEEARAYYDANRETYMTQELTEASYILRNAGETDPEPLRKRAREKADEAHARAVAGEDFAALAKEFSQAPNAAKGGALGMFPRGVMFPAFEKVAFDTEIGGISDVFETVTGYNIMKVTGRKPSEPIPFEEIRPQLKLQLIEEKKGQVMQAEMAKLRKAATVEVLDPDLIPDDLPAEN
ncbi:MAG: peptidylprolyl isomerase [Acidobacteria bacterium]|uniref:peptidylprolyl isomerase n=1 Tax=Candidatus Polarisedimenticola svalbardensis TaxID=2886004 RepID=A0A8J6Y2U3_9BACT|nr:peptidylprolyl isomerase [Candidatus Polarisedimenticola svalbardensis]